MQYNYNFIDYVSEVEWLRSLVERVFISPPAATCGESAFLQAGGPYICSCGL